MGSRDKLDERRAQIVVSNTESLALGRDPALDRSRLLLGRASRSMPRLPPQSRRLLLLGSRLGALARSSTRNQQTTGSQNRRTLTQTMERPASPVRILAHGPQGLACRAVLAQQKH